MSYAARALSGYRRLFRARKSLFVGDDRAMRESRVAIRAQFDTNRDASDPAHLEGLLTMIDDAEDMLLHGIAQGELNQETGNYEVKIKPEHTVDAGQAPNNLEPITQETADRMENGPEVTVTSCKSQGDGGKSGP